jgi:hypothetical protein
MFKPTQQPATTNNYVQTFVQKLNWMSETAFMELYALSSCLPGPTSTQVCLIHLLFVVHLHRHLKQLDILRHERFFLILLAIQAVTILSVG